MNLISIVLFAAGAAAALTSSSRSNDQQNGVQGEYGLGKYGNEKYGKVGKYDQYEADQQYYESRPNQYGAGQNKGSYLWRPRSGKQEQNDKYNPGQYQGGQQEEYKENQNGSGQYDSGENKSPFHKRPREGQRFQNEEYKAGQYEGGQQEEYENYSNGPNQYGNGQNQYSYIQRSQSGLNGQVGKYGPRHFEAQQQSNSEEYQNGPNQYGPGNNRKYGPLPGQRSYSAQPRAYYQARYRFDEPGMGVYDSAAYFNFQKNVGVDNLNQNAAVAQRLVPDEEHEPPTDNDFGLSTIDSDILEELKMFDEPVFAFYYKGSPKPELYQLKDAEKILKNPKYNKAKKTMVYIHGFLEGRFADSVKDVVKTYLDNDDYNVLIVDWHWYAAPPYFLKAVPNVKKVGVRVARALMDMINSGLTTQNLHVVGHSLGGQMAGVIGRTIQKESGGALILQRISALDPAFPGFYGVPNVQPLNEYDAEYVDVLHTDVGVYGAPVRTGTVDFWPNGGLPPQPGCMTNVCSHQRSWWYWGGSVLKNATNYFSAVKAKSWWSFRDGEADEYDPKIAMGISCPSGLVGNYYLVTNDKLPYARGTDGISWVAKQFAGALPPTPLLQSEPAIVPNESFF